MLDIFKLENLASFSFNFFFHFVLLVKEYPINALFTFLQHLEGVPDLHLFFMSGNTESSTQTKPQSCNFERWIIASLPS